MESGEGPVIFEAVVPTDDAEADDMALVVEDLEALGAGLGVEAGDDVDLPEGTDGDGDVDDVAALDEVLVGLGVVEAADHGPHSGDRGGNLLDRGGAALVGANIVSVLTRDGVRHRGGAR